MYSYISTLKVYLMLSKFSFILVYHPRTKMIVQYQIGQNKVSFKPKFCLTCSQKSVGWKEGCGAVVVDFLWEKTMTQDRLVH